MSQQFEEILRATLWGSLATAIQPPAPPRYKQRNVDVSMRVGGPSVKGVGCTVSTPAPRRLRHPPDHGLAKKLKTVKKQRNQKN